MVAQMPDVCGAGFVEIKAAVDALQHAVIGQSRHMLPGKVEMFRQGRRRDHRRLGFQPAFAYAVFVKRLAREIRTHAVGRHPPLRPYPQYLGND